jgi:hypothetical protein
MKSKIVVLSISLLLMVSLAVFAADTAMVNGEMSVSPAIPRFSVTNQVPDFYAIGESNGVKLEISPNGGTLSTTASSQALTPWGYVTATWPAGTVYIIFLANVTQNDFSIDFLYLTNSSSQFTLRTFGYQSATLSMMTFDGNEIVNSGMVETTSVDMPKISLDVKPRVNNPLSAIGPSIYINQNSGTIISGTTMLKVTPIQNQIFQSPTDYNELWALLTDDVGDYYFAILYMQNSDQSHVILEHEIRLNDYQTVPGQTFNAQWTGGPLPSNLKVTLPEPNLIVKVDGFPFQTDNRGQALISVPQGSITVETPNEITPAPGVRMHFSSWGDSGNANPLKLNIDSYADLKARYQSEYQLTIDSPYGPAKGAGWYAQASNATFSVPSMIDLNNGTRRVFQQFVGDYNSTSNSGILIMNSPKHVITNWQTQFYVQLQTSGAPSNFTVAVAVDGNLQFVSESSSSGLWVSRGHQLNIQVQTKQIPGAGLNYNFQELRVNGQTSSGNIVVNGPMSIEILFSQEQKASSTIDLKVNPTSTLSGNPVTIAGSVSGSNGPSNVTLSISSNKVDWRQLAKVPLGASGSFSYAWIPSQPQTYYITATWPGDSQHAPSSATTSVDVQNPAPIGIPTSSGLQNIVQTISNQLRAIPLLALPLKLVTSLLTLGTITADSLFPNASGVGGYFIGSLLVGFVFVFPISAIVLSIKAARSRKSPSFVWLIPLATVWIAALFVLVASGIFFSVPQALLSASAFLLVSSNTLLIPLVFSFFLARTLAG